MWFVNLQATQAKHDPVNVHKQKTHPKRNFRQEYPQTKDNPPVETADANSMESPKTARPEVHVVPTANLS